MVGRSGGRANEEDGLSEEEEAFSRVLLKVNTGNGGGGSGGQGDSLAIDSVRSGEGAREFSVISIEGMGVAFVETETRGTSALEDEVVVVLSDDLTVVQMFVKGC